MILLPLLKIVKRARWGSNPDPTLRMRHTVHCATSQPFTKYRSSSLRTLKNEKKYFSIKFSIISLHLLSGSKKSEYLSIKQQYLDISI